MCEVNRKTISWKAYEHLKGLGVTVSEKRGFMAISRENAIEIYGLRSCEKIKDIIFSNPSGFCMDPAETVLICYDTGNRIMFINTLTWEHELKYLDIENNIGTDEFEIGKMFYLAEDYLLIASLIYDAIYIYDKKIIFWKRYMRYLKIVMK